MRDDRIDFFKGMLMYFVIYGHTNNILLSGIPHSSIWAHTFVRVFDLPFFMILSGYFLRKGLQRRCALDVVLNRISMVFVPILLWTLVRGHVVFVMYYFLWAVLISSMLCVVGSMFKILLPIRVGCALELVYYGCIIVVLHIFSVPWNLFYLFPFFIVGYYLRDHQFILSSRKYLIVGLGFIALMCFWSPDYTPWRCGALAWRDDASVILIYVYRFVMGVVGVIVMARVFDVVRNLLNQDSFFVKVISRCGKETLALYILQSIFIERILGQVCVDVCKYCAIVVTRPIVNVVGYIIAPILSFLFMLILLEVIKYIKNIAIVRYVFGFKIR